MGLGYIGLPTAALIASKGVRVYGVDINPEVVNTINNGRIHIFEPDLEWLVYKVVSDGFLKAYTEPSTASTFIIAVPTPFNKDYSPNLIYVKTAIEMILPYVEMGNLIIIESTIPVGETRKMYDMIVGRRPELREKIYMAYCPERVLPGRILYELEHNDRIIGGVNSASSKKAAEFYSLFVKGKLHLTDAGTAEMCKLVENAFRDVNIAFANELSMIADKMGINVQELIDLANKHPRVNILRPGVGVGGHCIAVDPWFLITQHPEETKLIKTAREVNLRKTEWVIEKIKVEVEKFRSNTHQEPLIACLGLTYKPNVGDLRESPALYITKRLVSLGYNVVAYDPYIDEIEGVDLLPLDSIIKEADILNFLVDHTEFRNRLPKLSSMDDKTCLDFCGIHND